MKVGAGQYKHWIFVFSVLYFVCAFYFVVCSLFVVLYSMRPEIEMDFCHYSYFKSTSKTKAGLGQDESLNEHGDFRTGPGVQSVVWLQFYIL